jgi:hypothetical protein
VSADGPVGAPAKPDPDEPDTAEPTSAERQADAPAGRPAEPAQDSFLGHLLTNLWSANTVTVTALSVVLAMLIGAVLIVVSDAEVLATYSYIFARPSDALNGSWTLISGAYAELFKGSILDPAAVSAWLGGTGSWQAAFTPISETLTYAAPIVFTGLAVALAFRGGLFNIGAQGQAILGTICAGLAGFLLPLPPVLHPHPMPAQRRTHTQGGRRERRRSDRSTGEARPRRAGHGRAHLR